MATKKKVPEQKKPAGRKKRTGLNARDKAFVEARITAKTATAAVKSVDPKLTGASARTTAAVLESREEIQKALEERRAELRERSRVHTDEIIGDAVAAMHAHIGDCIDVTEDGRGFSINLAKARRTGAIHYIKRLSFDKYGQPSIEMAGRDAPRAQLIGIFGLKQEPRPNDSEAAKRREVERSIANIMERDKCDKRTAALTLRAQLIDLPALLPIVNEYAN